MDHFNKEKNVCRKFESALKVYEEMHKEWYKQRLTSCETFSVFLKEMDFVAHFTFSQDSLTGQERERARLNEHVKELITSQVVCVLCIQ